MKRELSSYLENLLKKNEMPYYEVFTLLIELRESNVTRLLEESAKLSSKDARYSKMLGFQQTYPILCLIDIFSMSSTLSNSLLISSIKEIMAEGKMLTKAEKEEYI